MSSPFDGTQAAYMRRSCAEGCSNTRERKGVEVGKVVRELRERAGMSQDDLASRIYVSRQTISSWENGKTYPDLRSLLLLSDVFDVSVDKIVGKDVNTMTQNIDRSAKTLNRLAYLMVGFFVLFMAALIWLGIQLLAWDWGAMQVAPTVCLVAVFAVGIIAASLGAERLKKDNDLVTYSEIAAFLKGEKVERDTDRRQQLTNPSIPRLFGRFLFGCAVGVVFGLVAVFIILFIRG